MKQGGNQGLVFSTRNKFVDIQEDLEAMIMEEEKRETEQNTHQVVLAEDNLLLTNHPEKGGMETRSTPIKDSLMQVDEAMNNGVNLESWEKPLGINNENT